MSEAAHSDVLVQSLEEGEVVNCGVALVHSVDVRTSEQSWSFHTFGEISDEELTGILRINLRIVLEDTIGSWGVPELPNVSIVDHAEIEHTSDEAESADVTNRGVAFASLIAPLMLSPFAPGQETVGVYSMLYVCSAAEHATWVTRRASVHNEEVLGALLVQLELFERELLTEWADDE